MTETSISRKKTEKSPITDTERETPFLTDEGRKPDSKQDAKIKLGKVILEIPTYSTVVKLNSFPAFQDPKIISNHWKLTQTETISRTQSQKRNKHTH